MKLPFTFEKVVLFGVITMFARLNASSQNENIYGGEEGEVDSYDAIYDVTDDMTAWEEVPEDFCGWNPKSSQLSAEFREKTKGDKWSIHVTKNHPVTGRGERFFWNNRTRTSQWHLPIGTIEKPLPTHKTTMDEDRECEACHMITNKFFELFMKEWNSASAILGKKQKVVKDQIMKEGGHVKEFESRLDPEEAPEISVGSILVNTCKTAAKQHYIYGPTVLHDCVRFLEKHQAAFIEHLLTKNDLDEFGKFYQYKSKICEQIYDGCMPSRPKRMSRCQACRAVVVDVYRTFVWGEDRRDHFRSSEQMYQIFENTCEYIAARNPVSHEEILTDTCDTMNEEHATEMEAIFTQDPLPQRPPLKICEDVYRVCRSRRKKKKSKQKNEEKRKKAANLDEFMMTGGRDPISDS